MADRILCKSKVASGENKMCDHVVSWKVVFLSILDTFILKLTWCCLCLEMYNAEQSAHQADVWKLSWTGYKRNECMLNDDISKPFVNGQKPLFSN